MNKKLKLQSMVGKDHLGDQTYLEQSYYDGPQGNRGKKVRTGSE